MEEIDVQCNHGHFMYKETVKSNDGKQTFEYWKSDYCRTRAPCWLVETTKKRWDNIKSKYFIVIPCFNE